MSDLQFNNLSCLSRQFVGKIQTAESVRISVKNDIAEVISVGVDSAVNSYEATRGEVSFYGKTNVKLLYSDGTTVLGQSFNADFTASMTNELLDTDSKLVFQVTTVDSKTETNANTATLTILLEICAYAYVSQSVPALTGNDGVFCQTQNTEYLLSADVFSLPLVVDEELNASRNITSALLAESSVCATDYTLTDGVLRLGGDAVVRLTYVSDGEIVTDNLPFKFERELDAAGIDADCQLVVRLVVKNTKVRLSVSDDDTNTTFSVEIGMTALVEATKIGSCDIVTDAYGSDCDFAFERRSVVTTLPCGSTVERRRVSGSLPLQSGKTPVTAVNVGATVNKCTSLERNVQVEGIVFATIVYSTESGTVGEQAELPFVETIPVDYLMPACQCQARIAVCDFAVKEANGLQIEAELCFAVDSQHDVTFPVIVSAEEQPFDKASLPAIEVCLARKGETLWQLCKGLHMSEEDLLAVNPEITDPLQADARIVIYNKI